MTSKILQSPAENTVLLVGSDYSVFSRLRRRSWRPVRRFSTSHLDELQATIALLFPTSTSQQAARERLSHESSFNIRDADDFLQEIIVPQYQEFLTDNGSARHALLAIIVVFHTYEWVHKRPFRKGQFENAYPDQPEVEKYLFLSQQIANGTKHFRNKRAKTRAQSGFSSGFGDGFARPLVIQSEDGTECSADQLLRTLVGYWKRHLSHRDPGA